MSLNWEFKDAPCIGTDGTIKEDMRDKANCLVWATLLVHLGDLTEKTLPEWNYRRDILRELGTSFGEGAQEDGTRFQWWPDEDELRQYMPLLTNVTPMTRAQWHRHIIKVLETRAESTRYRTAKEATKAQEGK